MRRKTASLSLSAIPCFETLATPLTVVDVTRLALTSRHFQSKPWPRLAVLWTEGTPKLSLPKDDLIPLLHRLGDRLRGPARVHAAGVAVGSADTPQLLAWAEEDAHRATWVITAVLSSSWPDIASVSYIARFLTSGLAAWLQARVSTACAVLEMVRQLPWEIPDELSDALRDAGVARVLEHLLQNGPVMAQCAASEAIQYACDMCCDPLCVADTDVIPALVSIAHLGPVENKLAALKALSLLGDRPTKFPDVGFPVLVDLLAHTDDDVKEEASSALWAFIQNREDSARKACDHGCISHLIAQLHNKRILRQYPLFCLESVLALATARATAVELGLLPVLFQCLQEEKQTFHIEVILELLKMCVTHVPLALQQQTAAQRKAAMRKIVAAANSRANRTEARQLLQLLDQASPWMSRLIRQAGYQQP